MSNTKDSMGNTIIRHRIEAGEGDIITRVILISSYFGGVALGGFFIEVNSLPGIVEYGTAAGMAVGSVAGFYAILKAKGTKYSIREKVGEKTPNNNYLQNLFGIIRPTQQKRALMSWDTGRPVEGNFGLVKKSIDDKPAVVLGSQVTNSIERSIRGTYLVQEIAPAPDALWDETYKRLLKVHKFEK